MYALEPAWRDTLQAPAPGVSPLAVDAASWAGHEFGGRGWATRGSTTRGWATRLVLSAEQMAESPMRTSPAPRTE